ncbi:MAG: hypothetical protein J6T55_01675, partial [Alphaproteobacteria bacterium]|nr:hypothetical protein [Alphaproteobacteria bacterium]
MECSPKTLCLVDGSGYIFRAFYALPPMNRADGTPVNALYGFTAMMMSLLQENACDNIVVVFDAARRNFRNEIYPEYKANRSETPPELIPQFPLIREACDALNVAKIEKEGYEADDLIATYARIAKEKGMKARIISADKDLMQLMDNNTSLYDPMKKKEITLEDVEKKFGVAPDKVIEVQALMGDSTDNIPGASGVGPKTAATLIQQFGSIQNMFAHLDEISSEKRREGLQADKEKIEISKKLVTLDKFVPVDENLTTFARQNIQIQKLTDFLNLNNFSSLVKRLSSSHFERKSAEVSQKEIKIITLTNEKEIQEMIQELRQTPRFSFYLEQNESDEFIGIELANQSCVYHIDLMNPLPQRDLFSNAETVFSSGFLKLLKPLFEDKNLIKVGHDIKMAIHSLASKGITVEKPYEDIMLMSYDLDGSKHAHDLETLMQIYFPNQEKAGKEAFFMGEIAKQIKEKLITQNELAIYEDIDAPLIPILVDMEKEGILLDKKHLKKLDTLFSQRLNDLTDKIHTLTGEEVNINSPIQLGIILFEKRGLPGGKKGPNGHWITDVKVLEKLAHEEGDELAELILQYR